MVRYVVRAVVKNGHRRAFLTAFDTWKRAAVEAGLPAYRLYESTWGTYGEFFAAAEFEESADIDRRIGAALQVPEYEAAHEGVLAHLVEGTMRDYVLSEVTM